MTDPLHIQARLLPHGQQTDLWIVDGRISRHCVPQARTIADGGWMLPALVDTHVHLGVGEVGGPFDRDLFESQLDELAVTGIGAVRSLGGPGPLPSTTSASGPLLLPAERPLSTPGGGIPGWVQEVENGEQARSAVASQAAPWVKVMADWFDSAGGYSATFTEADLRIIVERAARTGRRVAAHAQSAEGGRRAILAGVHTVEHGMHLPVDLFPDWAAEGGTLVPTGSVFQNQAGAMTADGVPADIAAWFGEGLRTHPQRVQQAWQVGVTVLAGTDQPLGALVDEIQWLERAGLPTEAAIGAASWTARRALDLPRLREGDRADLIWLAQDPRADLELLRHPDLVLLAGVLRTR